MTESELKALELKYEVHIPYSNGYADAEAKWLSVIEDINKQLEELINKPCVNQNMMAQNLAYRNVQEIIKKQIGEVTKNDK